ncbi:MAG: thiamine diphosphokinase [Lachnospiraceae bacterium]|nr:thiamine diphosphokinase [Lachnospiraceae bacterium]
MNNTLIITGGFINIEFAKKYLQNNEFSKVIAVDGGLLAADKLSVIPDYIVGDFDTVSPLLLYKYEKMSNVQIIRYRPEKDFTDTYIAVQKAIEENSFSIHILGGMGSRLDHTLANVQLLQYALHKGIEAVLVSPKNRVRLLGDKRRSIVLRREEVPYKYISLMPVSESVKSVTTTGMKYNVNNFDFQLDQNVSMGVSNEIKNDEAEIHISHGELLLIESND